MTISFSGHEESGDMGVGPAPATAVTNGVGGPTQANASAIIFYATEESDDWNPNSGGLPPSTVFLGAGGPTQALVTAIIFKDHEEAWDWGHTIASAAFTYAINDPTFAPKRVSFDASGSVGFLSPSYFWDFGAGDPNRYGAGLTIVHDFEEFGTYPVTLLVTDAAGINLTDTVIVNVVVEDQREQPVESAEDVMNMTLGRHGYEPLRTSEGVSEDDEVRVFGDGLVAAASPFDLITLEVPNFSTIRNILVSGDCDAIYRVYVDDVQVVPKKRIYRHHKDTDILGGATIAMRERQTIRVEVYNEGSNSAEFEASIHGSRI